MQLCNTGAKSAAPAPPAALRACIAGQASAGAAARCPSRFRNQLGRHLVVRTSACIACGKCVEVCPIEVPDEFNHGLTKRKAIYRPFTQSVPAAYLIDHPQEAPCKSGCPEGGWGRAAWATSARSCLPFTPT